MTIVDEILADEDRQRRVDEAVALITDYLFENAGRVHRRSVDDITAWVQRHYAAADHTQDAAREAGGVTKFPPFAPTSVDDD